MSTWGRSNPEDEPSAPIVQVERVGGDGAKSRLIVGLVAVVLVVGTLWVKPWNNAPPSTAGLPPLAEPSEMATAPEATATEPTTIVSGPARTLNPLAEAARRRQCQSGEEWRMVTAESTFTRDTRTMYAASPVRASGPDDPNLPLSHLYANSLRAVGVCVPRSPVVSPVTTLLQVVLWQVEHDGTVREIQRPVIVDWELFDMGEAYYAPPTGEGTFWPAGRYVFEIRRAAGGASRWIGLDFVLTGPRRSNPNGLSGRSR